ncbi:MAG TPA: hypothetical protein HA340_00360 [Candidatus Thalassarchaeaceae archaeon]|nr:MAG TPA: hypothetical protein D7H97_00345 [Candidatus Poseidoniales archaeon]HIH82377.1 hypothetical protein [Candidatus Thalassarchaeaceae archaeon]
MNTRIVIILTTALLLGMVVPLSTPSMAAAPPSDGSSVTIAEDTTWNQSSNMDGTVIVSAGVNLTITGEITVEAGSSMDVQGNLIMNGGSLNAANPPSDLQFWSAYGDSSTLFLPESAGTFAIEIFSASGYNLSNYTAQWNDGPKEDLEGDNHSMMAGIANPLPGGGTLSFEAIIGEYGELVIDRIEVHRTLPLPGDNIYEVTELDYSGWLLRGEAGFSLNVAEGGSLSASGATISGAQISINGQVDASNTEIVASGPLSISGATSSITMNGGGFDGSSDDHDILADTVATISLTDVNGTGGIIDFWERQLSEQVIQFPGTGITFTLTGVGPQERTLQGLSMADGTFVVPANYQQGPRVIEIGYADGTVWTEHATISNISWFTAWGTFYDSGGTLEHIEDPSVTFSIIPQISVTSVEITKEATLGKRATVVVTLANTGNADAGNPYDEIDSVAIECYDGENRADISPTYPAADVAAGSSVDIELRWGHADEGNATLVCNPLTPSQVAIEGALGGGTTESQTMLWSPAAEASPGMSPLLISLLVALVVGLGLVAYFTAIVGKEETRTITIKDSDDELDELDDL